MSKHLSKHAPEHYLQDGLDILCGTAAEARAIHEDLSDYWQMGVTVGEGALVVDAGANAGQFALDANRRAGNTAVIYAFEPIPAIAELLKHNLGLMDSNRLRAFDFALGEHASEREFAYHWDASLLSNGFPEDVGREAGKLKETLLRNCVIPDPHPRLRPLGKIPFAFFRKRLLNFAMDKHFAFERITRPVRPLSDFLDEQGVTAVDLLKINVERMEWEVLLGIRDHHWPMIRQAVIEVHDLDGRLREVQELLRGRNFPHVSVKQTPIFQGSDTYLVFARRD